MEHKKVLNDMIAVAVEAAKRHQLKSFKYRWSLYLKLATTNAMGEIVLVHEEQEAPTDAVLWVRNIFNGWQEYTQWHGIVLSHVHRAPILCLPEISKD